jgi:predicted nucleotidyltransferase component of viral defense system
MLKEWLAKFNYTTVEQEFKAKREILQHIILSGLSRSDFYTHAAFYGGTALRILYGLPRYSEDIDFSLNYKDAEFTLEKYLPIIEEECKLYGLDITIKIKHNINPNAIQSAFLKDNTQWSEIIFDGKRDKLIHDVKVKIEIDRNPPLKFNTEQKLIVTPYSFYVNTFTKESLFAGKMHVLLFREWKTRVKGRDWFDLEWYIKNNIALDIMHLQERAWQSGHISKKEKLNATKLKNLLDAKIKKLDVKNAMFDVRKFVQQPASLDIWSTQYFLDLVKGIKIK